MIMKTVFILVLISVFGVQIIKTDYVAATVEYQPMSGSTPNETVESNLNQYIYNIEQARAKNVQIIVFPEYGLTGFVSDPTGYAIDIPLPGNKNFSDYWLQKLSDAAIAHSMYIVVNLLEKEKSVENVTYYYSTTVVFDKLGQLTAKYRKVNVQGEPALSPGDPIQNENTFITDFGITFGILTSYDIINYNSLKSIFNTSITDIVYPTAWNSVLPYYHSLSIQNGFAAANKVNLLAANINNMQNGIGGSGIYSADGSIFTYYMPKTEGTTLNTATVKNAPSPSNATFNSFGFEVLFGDSLTTIEFNAKRYFDSEKYVFKMLNISQLSIKEEVCHRSYCCIFNVNTSSTTVNSSEVYQIMAYYGKLSLGESRTQNVKVCSLLACESSDTSTCGNKNIKTSSKIESILVETNVADASEEFYQPTSVTGDLVPVFNTVFNSTINDGVRTFIYKASNITQQNIIAFGIVGNKGVTLSLNAILMCTILFLTHMW